MLLQGNNLGFSVPVVFRSKTQCAGNGYSPYQALQRSCGAPQLRPEGWPVSVHGVVTYMDVGQGREQDAVALRLLQRTWAICGETRLAMNADRLTASQIITL